MFNAEILIPSLLTICAVLIFHLNTDGSHPLVENSKLLVVGMPDNSKINERLEKIGRKNQYGSFRIKQVTIALASSAITFLVGSVMIQKPPVVLIFALLAFFLAFLYEERRLTTLVVRRREEIEAEFAPVIEMLTLSLSAGESPLGALNRIAERSQGLLAQEFREVIEAVRHGVPFHTALDLMGRRVDSILIRRFIDALITAMLRGAPLVEILQRHAAEARTNQRNIMMNKAGKAEVSMMVPVVFLILPISVLFALWPSLNHLNLFAG